MFSFNMFPEPMRPFNTQYRCYSVSMLPGNERHDVEKGGKIIMPPSALDHLTRLNIVYPMLFKLTNSKTNRVTHCGVLEFVADEGKVYLPYWMMRNLLLEEGGILQVESATLPVATFSKFQPQSEDFLDITNPKAVLENALRNFACLTAGDIIAIEYNNKIYELCVLETKPGSAVSIIECDMNVEFAAPVGYKEPERKQSHQTSSQEEMNFDINNLQVDNPEFVAFSGKGNRLDGKKKGTDPLVSSTNRFPQKRGIPDYDYQIGTLRFIRTVRPVQNEFDCLLDLYVQCQYSPTYTMK
ncbi:ubiquitin fusion-degradation 1-like isoform X1 [Tachypleus tridentatus]|uniref:ubiquitin fusion-degradation 1-like isoform X1 n=1 Tax=Tachypleus tridentatus TaxID=6853 RepID=UPI003FCEF85C